MNKKLHKKVDNILTSPTQTIAYFYQDNFTVAIIIDAVKVKPVSVGVAKCNCNFDECDSERGREIALARAVKNMSKRRKK